MSSVKALKFKVGSKSQSEGKKALDITGDKVISGVSFCQILKTELLQARPLSFLTYLKDVKFQIVGGLIPGPQDRMVRGLGAVFHLAEPLMHAGGRLPDRLGEQGRIHEMGAGAGGQIASVLYQAQAPQVYLPVASDRVLDRAAGLGEGRRVQDDHIEPLTSPFQLGQELKDIGALEGNGPGKTV